MNNTHPARGATVCTCTCPDRGDNTVRRDAGGPVSTAHRCPGPGWLWVVEHVEAARDGATALEMVQFLLAQDGSLGARVLRGPWRAQGFFVATGVGRDTPLPDGSALRLTRRSLLTCPWPRLSLGHVGLDQSTEWLTYTAGGDVYRSPLGSPFERGRRMGGRWECRADHFRRYRDTVFVPGGLVLSPCCLTHLLDDPEDTP